MFPLPQNFSVASETLISASALILFVAIVLGGLNVAKVKTLNSSLNFAIAAHESLERSRAQNDKELKLREAAIAAEQTTLAKREGKTPAGEAQLAQVLSEKTQLEAKLHDKESEILDLQKRIEESSRLWSVRVRHRPTSSGPNWMMLASNSTLPSARKVFSPKKFRPLPNVPRTLKMKRNGAQSPIGRSGSRARFWPLIKHITSWF